MKENYSYSIIKGGIDSATRQMASYYGKFNIRVNNLCPGALISHVAGLSKKQNKKFIDNFIRLNPIKRLGKADEVANVALFLGSDLSSYITGQSIYVDGGYTIIRMYLIKDIDEYNLLRSKKNIIAENKEIFF